MSDAEDLALVEDDIRAVVQGDPSGIHPHRSDKLAVLLAALDEARAELARRDTTIAAALASGPHGLAGLADALDQIVDEHKRGDGLDEGWTADVAQQLRTLRAALSAPVEAGATEPAPDALTAHTSISLDRPDGPNGSVDATCKCGAWATVLNDAEARAWWDEHKAGAVAEAGAPAERTSDTERPGICPTCESSQPHLHPHPDLCPDAWHKPVPTTIDGWRRETERWASLLHQIAEHGSSIPDVRRSVDLLADDMQRALTGSGPSQPTPTEEA